VLWLARVTLNSLSAAGKKMIEAVFSGGLPTDLVGKARCHTVNVIEGLKCAACGEIIPQVDRYETARLLLDRKAST